jgi:alginate O-acetyltransferase complex protein AlgI
MLFNSVTYLMFLPVVVAVYWLIRQRLRQWLILFASLVFYGFWRVEFIPLLLASALMDYFLALAIERSENSTRRRRMLVVSIAANLGILFFFKYLVFFTQAAGSIAQLIGYQPSFVEMKVILPLGISFYIFATISYVIDVYRKEFPAERDLLTYMCFVVYFPHLVAGPILRARSLIPQLKSPEPLSTLLFADGIQRILFGLFLKVVIADQIGSLVDEGFQRDPSSLSALDCWTLAFLFGFQIYFDFCAYSHIAIGSSLLMGVRLPENFNFPYMAASPRDFWRRWHISLSTWIRDYVYLPLSGGYKRTDIPLGASAPLLEMPQEQRTIPLYVTWVLMGFWHGAAWNFGIWGLYHAIVVHAHRLVFRKLPIGTTFMVGVLSWFLTLLAMMAGWIPFRAQSVSQTFAMWAKLLKPTEYFSLTLLPIAYITAAVVMIGIVITGLVAKYLLPHREYAARLQHPALLFLLNTILITGIFVFLRITSQFIYFQF